MLNFVLRRLLPLVVLGSLGLSSCVVREPRRGGYGYGYGRDDHHDRHDRHDDHHDRHDDHHDRRGRYGRH